MTRVVHGLSRSIKILPSKSRDRGDPNGAFPPGIITGCHYINIFSSRKVTFGHFFENFLAHSLKGVKTSFGARITLLMTRTMTFIAIIRVKT